MNRPASGSTNVLDRPEWVVLAPTGSAFGSRIEASPVTEIEVPEAIPYLFGVMCLMGVLLFWLTLKLNRTIRGAYAGRWPELREPSILTASIRDSLAMQRWLYRRDYVSSGDPKLIELCDTIRISSGIYLAVFVATMAAMLWSFSSVS